MFLKSISSHTHAFCSQNSMLWGVSVIFCFVFLNFFSRKFWLGSVYFDWLNLFFNQSKLQLKLLGLVLCVSIDQTYFSINWKSYRDFLKHLILTCSNTFSKSFQTLSLSIRSVKAPIKFFLSFSSILFARFFSSKVSILSTLIMSLLPWMTSCLISLGLLSSGVLILGTPLLSSLRFIIFSLGLLIIHFGLSLIYTPFRWSVVHFCMP